MNRNRLVYLDSIKGFAIFLMVFAHTIAWSFTDYKSVVHYSVEQSANVVHAGFLWQFIYSFHMALFFLVSGYLTYKGGDILPALKKRTIRLLIPYFATGFFITLIRPGFGYWFLFSLWELSLIGILLYKLIDRLNKKGWILLDVFCILAANEVLVRLFSLPVFSNPVADIGYGFSFFLPFMFGMLMRKHKNLEEGLQNYYTAIFLLFIICFLSKYFSTENQYIALILKCVNWPIAKFHSTEILGSLSFYYLFKQGISAKLEDIFSWFGKRTFEIYLIHVFFVLRLTQVGDFWLKVDLPTCLGSQILYCTAISVFAMMVSVIIADMIKHSKILSKLLFGQ